MYELYSDDNSNRYPPEFNVTHDELIDAYSKIKKDLIAGKTPVENPISVNVGGQPGAGKTGLMNLAKTFFEDENFVVVDNDSWRETHPRYNMIVAHKKEECAPIAQYIRDLRTMMVRDLTADKYNLLVHLTMGDNEICFHVREQKLRGYRTSIVAALACNECESRLGIFDRFAKDMTTHGHARFSLREKHDKAYHGVETTLAQLEAEGYADDIRIYDRTYDLFYRSKMRQDQISNKSISSDQKYKTAVQALTSIRNRPWDNAKYDKFKQDSAELINRLNSLHVEGFIQESDYKKMISEIQRLPREAFKLLDVPKPHSRGQIL